MSPTICTGCGSLYDADYGGVRRALDEAPFCSYRCQTESAEKEERVEAGMNHPDITSDIPWENLDGSTNVEGFLAAYAADDNTFWRAEIGHIQNVLDDVLKQLTIVRGQQFVNGANIYAWKLRAEVAEKHLEETS